MGNSPSTESWDVCPTFEAEDWNTLYHYNTKPYEWYLRWSDLRRFLIGSPRNGRVLVVGCGTSLLSEHMGDDGFDPVISIDVSHVAIELMKKRHINQSTSLKWLQMDATNMSFPDNYFSYVIDKGTLDSLMCASYALETSQQYLSEVMRVLRPGGVFLVVSSQAPERRLLTLNCLERTDRVFEIQCNRLDQTQRAEFHFCPAAGDAVSCPDTSNSESDGLVEASEDRSLSEDRSFSDDNHPLEVSDNLEPPECFVYSCLVVAK